MRISDWSSDVCSSDLFLQRIGRSVQHLAKLRRQVAPVHTLLAGGRNDIARDKRPHPESATQRLARPLQPKVLLRGSKDDSGRGLCFRLADFHEIRSEEHTSELQSLMRISYAVFCLKKKKSTTLSTITH